MSDLGISNNLSSHKISLKSNDSSSRESLNLFIRESIERNKTKDIIADSKRELGLDENLNKKHQWSKQHQINSQKSQNLINSLIKPVITSKNEGKRS